MLSKAHPRYESLVLRDKIVKASKEGLLADSAMIAHGRGEAFDYLLGEKTTIPAKRAMYVTVALMILSKNPVISVNGNTTALAIDEIIEFAKAVDADTILVPLEDGDRAEILSKSGKNIITIDLNPLSRTSKMSDVSIVDNVVRAIPFMTKIADDLKSQDKELLKGMIKDFDNKTNLKESLNSFKIKEDIQ